MARHVAKNIVAVGLADECEIQLAYAIGVADPISVYVETNATAAIPDESIGKIIREHFPLTPQGIIEYLDLRRPIFRQTSWGGHFGRDEEDFTWESTDKAAELRDAAGLGKDETNFGTVRKAA